MAIFIALIAFFAWGAAVAGRAAATHAMRSALWKWASGFVFFALLVPMLFLAWIAIERARYPYNSEGRYFDAEASVVYQEDAVDVWRVLTLMFEIPCVFAGAAFAAMRRR
jgi:hypothetical protein